MFCDNEGPTGLPNVAGAQIFFGETLGLSPKWGKKPSKKAGRLKHILQPSKYVSSESQLLKICHLHLKHLKVGVNITWDQKLDFSGII